MKIEELENSFIRYKENKLSGRYLSFDHIRPLIDKFANTIEDIKVLGTSENKTPIHLIKIGEGKKRLLFWSQMHGNESTTTKAVFDLLNTLLDKKNEWSSLILKECTLFIIPMLNPDGSNAYTRLNYNNIDLNRDAQLKTQKESRIFSDLVQEIKPDIAFNLHGQRTIFSAGKTNKSAIISFLSPAGNKERSITNSRRIAMDIIVAMNEMLQLQLPGHVGRYDDGFNINCTGDTLETLKIPTILFEAGHYPQDYEREVTRKYIYYSLLTALNYITQKNTQNDAYYKKYFEIPENDKLFYDIIIRDTILEGKKTDIALQYKEVLVKNKVKFIPEVVKIEKLENFYGHLEIQAKSRRIRHYNDVVEIVQEVEMLKFYLNDELFSL